MTSGNENEAMAASNSAASTILKNNPSNKAVVIHGGDKPDNNKPTPSAELWDNISGSMAVIFPNWAGACLKSCLAVTVALYILNQKHLLPKPLSAFVSKALFWPTLPLTASRRLTTWSTVVDDTVLIGGVPLGGFFNYPERLYKAYGVRGVVNLCQEYRGPEKQYQRLRMRHLRLPTVDHFEPTVADLETAVAFIKKHKDQGSKVYVHCKAGHGRSAAVVFAWLLFKDPDADPKELNKEFCLIRNVRKTLWKQTNIKEFYARLQSGSIELTGLTEQSNDDEDEYDESDKEL